MTKFIANFQPEELRIKEVFVYYDRPLLFSAVDKLDHIFIGLLTEENDDLEIWLYSPISNSRYQSARRGLIEVRDIFSDSEPGFVYIVKVPYESQDILVDSEECKNLPDKWLPDPGNFLITEPVIEDEPLFLGDPENLSNSIQLRLNYGILYKKGFAPAKDLANVLSKFLELANEVAEKLTNSSLPFLVSAFGEGSFTVNLRAEETNNLFGDSTSTKTLHELFLLLDSETYKSVSSKDWVTDNIRKKVSNLVGSIPGKIKDFSLEWKSPVPNYGKKLKLDKQRIETLVEEIAAREVTSKIYEISVIGKLRGINLDTNYFNLVTNSTTKYTGKISNEIIDTFIVQSASLDKIYYARIEVTESKGVENIIPKVNNKLLALEIYTGPENS